MSQLFNRKNALWVALGALIISLVVFLVGNFVLLGYERELTTILELVPFALYASLVILWTH